MSEILNNKFVDKSIQQKEKDLANIDEKDTNDKNKKVSFLEQLSDYDIQLLNQHNSVIEKEMKRLAKNRSQLKYYHKNKKKFSSANNAKLREYRKEYYQEKKPIKYRREYYYKNLEKSRNSAKEYYYAHKEEILRK